MDTSYDSSALPHESLTLQLFVVDASLTLNGAAGSTGTAQGPGAGPLLIVRSLPENGSHFHLVSRVSTKLSSVY